MWPDSLAKIFVLTRLKFYVSDFTYRKHTFPIWHQPSIWSMHNCGILLFTQLFPIFDKHGDPLNSIFLVLHRIRFVRFLLTIWQHHLVVFIVFQIKIPSCGLQLGVVQRGLICIALQGDHYRTYTTELLRFGASHKTVISINNIRSYKSLEVKNLFNQMENHRNNVQTNVRFHE